MRSTSESEACDWTFKACWTALATSGDKAAIGDVRRSYTKIGCIVGHEVSDFELCGIEESESDPFEDFVDLLRRPQPCLVLL